MSWAQALRTFLASPPHIRQRDGASIFDCLCRAHLQGPPGHAIHVHSLPLLRQLRWEVLKLGTPGQKSRSLESILCSYSNASHSYTYDPLCSQKENHSLIIEQLQCIVEARLANIPLRTTHYRFLFQSPQLSQLSPNTPLLLFKEITNSGEMLTDDVRVDVGVGLASAGHWKEALRVCPSTDLVLLVERVAAAHRHGWRHACLLASHLMAAGGKGENGKELLPQGEAHFLCIMATFALQLAAMPDPAVGAKMENFMGEYIRQQDGGLPPRRAIEYFLSSCGPKQWRAALKLVTLHNSNCCCTAGVSTRIPLGKVMHLLNGANQWQRVLELYQNTPSVFASSEHQHAAVHNHALVALANSENMWQQAVWFYSTQSVRNVYTHIVWLRLVLLERKIPFATAWQSCIKAYNCIRNPDHRYSENLADQLVTIGQWIVALEIANRSSKKIPRILLTAIRAAAMYSNENVVWQAAKKLSLSRQGVSAKQLFTAAAFVACCTKNVPCEVSLTIAECIHNLTTSQEQYDDAVFHFVRCMATMQGIAGTEAKPNAPLEINFAVGPRFSRQISDGEDWIFALALLQKLYNKGWSFAAAAPAMLSSGFCASIAIRFLPG